MTNVERAQLTRWERTRRLRSMIAHPAFDNLVTTRFDAITQSEDMIILNAEAEARLSGGAEV